MASAYLSIGILAISWVIGFLFYHFMSASPKTEKKAQMEQVSSHLMNFIIFVFIGKVVLNFTSFLKDPMVILAYPSDSSAFYFAVFASTINIALRVKRGKTDVLTLLNTFIHLFLISSFVYEFLQIIVHDNMYSIRYFILLAALMLLLLIARSFLKMDTFVFIMFVSWGLGALGLSMMMPLFIVFGYTIEPSFLILFILACIALYVFYKRKKVL